MKKRTGLLPLVAAVAAHGFAVAGGREMPSGFGLPDAVTAVAPAVETSGRADELLGRLAGEFRKMHSYTVRFEISVGDAEPLSGAYSVQGDAYCLTLGDSEVFFDGRIRYEVYNDRREVVVSEVDSSSRNMLDNPVHAFDFLGGIYCPKLLEERDGCVVIELDPTDGSGSTGRVTVTLSVNPVRPVRLVYDYDGERVTVSVLSVASFAGELRRFDPAACKGYEFIDFR